MRVSTQAERGELELRLLEGSRFESRQPTNTYSNAIDLLDQNRLGRRATAVGGEDHLQTIRVGNSLRQSGRSVMV